MNIWIYFPPWKKEKNYQLHAYMDATDEQFWRMCDILGLLHSDGEYVMVEWGPDE